MLDLNFIRENVELVKENTKKRKSEADIDQILELDQKRREALLKVENLRAGVNAYSKSGKPPVEDIERLKKVKEEIQSLEEDLKVVETDLTEKLAWVPNISSPDMPEGTGEEDNVELKVWIPESGYLEQEKLGKGNNSAQYMPEKQGLHHQDLGEKLDIIDNKQSALTSGSRFVYLKNEAVILQYAIFQMMSKKLLADGFVPMIPPLLVKEKVLFGTSHFPEGKDQVYKIETENVEEKTDLYLVGSSEPALFAYFMNRTVSEDELPAKMFAMTPCFRSEVGSWGKDVRGIKRVHQFDKLDMDVVCTQEQSTEIMEYLLSINEWLLQELKIPYRVVNKSKGDAGYFASFKQYDVEAWLPTQGEFMEGMTDTNATDYQARRLNIKYVQKDGSKKYAHTVNDTGAAMGRLLIAIMDNYQQEDESIKTPDALLPFVNFTEIKPKSS